MLSIVNMPQIVASLQLAGRDIQHLIHSSKLIGSVHSAKHNNILAVKDIESYTQLPSVAAWVPTSAARAMATVSSQLSFDEVIRAAQKAGARLMLATQQTDSSLAGSQMAAAAPCQDSDRAGLRVTAGILEGLGVALLLAAFTALGLAALYCIATPTRLLEKDVPVGREH